MLEEDTTGQAARYIDIFSSSGISSEMPIVCSRSKIKLSTRQRLLESDWY